VWATFTFFIVSFHALAVSISVVVFCLFLLLFSFVGLFVGSVASVSLRVIGKQAYRIILDYNRHD